MIVEKAVKMAKMMNIPIIGIIENMSYLECPDCKKKIEVFGKSNIDKVAMEYGIPVLARIPICPDLASVCDKGVVELFEGDWLEPAVNQIEIM